MYENLKKVIIGEIEKRYEEKKKAIICFGEPEIKCYLTSLKIRQLEDGELSLEKAQEFVFKKLDKEMNKKIESELNSFKEIEESEKFTGCTISIEWKRSSMWGKNPTATLSGCGYIKGSSIGGCGYDKESTAVAQVINQCLPLKKLLYNLKENNIEVDNEKLFGYGSGYRILPYFEGGVGVSCYCSICEAIGFKFVSVAHGNNFDVYEIRKGE